MENNEQMRNEIRELKEQRHRDQMFPPSQQLHVAVNAPVPAPRLKIFTGLPPTSNMEITYEIWEEQTEQLLIEEPDDALRRLRQSLRGLAWEQVKDMNSPIEILKTIKTIFGSAQTAEDAYEQFQLIKIQNKETPAEYLLRLWSALEKINKLTGFDQEELNSKLYRTFLRGLGPRHHLLCLELRTKFGIPGTTSPNMATLIKTLRQLEGGTNSEAKLAQSHTHVQQVQQQVSGLSDADLEKIIEGVTRRLQPFNLSTPGCTRNPHPQTPLPKPLASPTESYPIPRNLKGVCYRCQGKGHYARECPTRSSQPRSLNYNQSQARGTLRLPVVQNPASIQNVFNHPYRQK